MWKYSEIHSKHFWKLSISENLDTSWWQLFVCSLISRPYSSYSSCHLSVCWAFLLSRLHETFFTQTTCRTTLDTSQWLWVWGKGERGCAQLFDYAGYRLLSKVFGYYLSFSILMQSPEPMLNSLSTCIPSLIPATPAYDFCNIDPQYEFPPENLELTDILLDGTYSVIYKANAQGIQEDKTIEVAVKTVKGETDATWHCLLHTISLLSLILCSIQIKIVYYQSLLTNLYVYVCLMSIDEFLNIEDYVSHMMLEMEQMANMDAHPNVVKLLKVCTVGSELH